MPLNIMKEADDQPRIKQNFNGQILFIYLIADRRFWVNQHERGRLNELRAQLKVVLLLVAACANSIRLPVTCAGRVGERPETPYPFSDRAS